MEISTCQRVYENHQHYLDTAEHSRDELPIPDATNITVKEMVLPLLLESGLPSVFWYKAVKHAVYIINMLTTTTIKGYISPVEFLTGDAPNASELKLCGCNG